MTPCKVAMPAWLPGSVRSWVAKACSYHCSAAAGSPMRRSTQPMPPSARTRSAGGSEAAMACKAPA